VACTATTRRPTGHDTGLLDRPTRRHISVVLESIAASGSGIATAGRTLSPSSPRALDERTNPEMTPTGCWALLPEAERELLGLRFSRLVLKALRPLDIMEDR
jgi:hypothetical protein